TGDQQADMLLQSARKAYGEKNYAFAATRFREFLGKFGGHKDAPAARYGLALALLENHPKKYNEIREVLGSLAGNKNEPDHRFIGLQRGGARGGTGKGDGGAGNPNATRGKQVPRQRPPALRGGPAAVRPGTDGVRGEGARAGPGCQGASSRAGVGHPRSLR